MPSEGELLPKVGAVCGRTPYIRRVDTRYKHHAHGASLVHRFARYQEAILQIRLRVSLHIQALFRPSPNLPPSSQGRA